MKALIALSLLLAIGTASAAPADTTAKAKKILKSVATGVLMNGTDSNNQNPCTASISKRGNKIVVQVNGTKITVPVATIDPRNAAKESLIYDETDILKAVAYWKDGQIQTYAIIAMNDDLASADFIAVGGPDQNAELCDVNN